MRAITAMLLCPCGQEYFSRRHSKNFPTQTQPFRVLAEHASVSRSVLKNSAQALF